MAGLSTLHEPKSEPVSLPEASLFIRQVDEGDNRVVERLIAAARHHVEQLTRRAFVTRTLQATFDDWPSCRDFYKRRDEPELILPNATPLKQIVKVEYLDLDRVTQTLATTVYQAVTNKEPGRLRRRKEQVWPDTSDEPDAITVTYQVGYGTDDDVPDDAKTAILMLVAHWYENREAVDVSTGGTVTTVPHGFSAIVNNLHVPLVV